MLSSLATAFSATLVGCAFSQSAIVPRSQDLQNSLPERRIVFVRGGRECETNRIVADEVFSQSVESLSKAVGQLGTAQKEITLVDPSSRELLDLLHKDAELPLWLIYVGHGSRPSQDNASMLCLRDGALSVGKVLTALPSTIPSVSVMLDACQSAFVSVHDRAYPLSVISASPGRVHTGLRETVIAEELSKALGASIDANRDGLVTDQEVFDALNRPISDVNTIETKHRTELSPQPKLRRQATAPIPLLRLKNATIPPWTRVPEAFREATQFERSVREHGHLDLLNVPPSVWLFAADVVAPQSAPPAKTMVGRLDDASWTEGFAWVRVYRVSKGAAADVEIRSGHGVAVIGRIASSPNAGLSWSQMARALQRHRQPITTEEGNVQWHYSGWLSAEDLETIRDEHLIAVPCSKDEGQCFMSQ